MEKQFVLKPAKALKKIKSLAAKHEFTNKLDFSTLAVCCGAGPVVDCTAPVFSL